MPIRAPGPSDPDVGGFLNEVSDAQKSIDGYIDRAKALPDSDLTKSAKIAQYNQLKREVSQTSSRLQRQTSQWAGESIPRLYNQGFMVAGLQLDSGFGFSVTHQEAVDVLVRDAFDDVATGLKQVSADFNGKLDTMRTWEQLSPEKRAIIQTSSKSAVSQQLLTGLQDPKRVAQDLRDKLWENGVEIVDRSGKRWGMETYTRMLVRTKSGAAYNSGALNKCAEEGVMRVQVFDGTEDEACAEANGQIWTIKYAQQHILAHPNCRRAFGPLPGVGPISKADIKEIPSTAQGVMKEYDEWRRLLLSSQSVKRYQEWRMHPGVIDLQDQILESFPFLSALRGTELRIFGTNRRTNQLIQGANRVAEDFVNPWAVRMHLIKQQDVPAHVEKDWDFLVNKITQTIRKERSLIDFQTVQEVFWKEYEAAFNDVAAVVMRRLDQQPVVQFIKSWKLSGGVIDLKPVLLARSQSLRQMSALEMRVFRRTTQTDRLISLINRFVAGIVDPLAESYGLLDSLPESVVKDWDSIVRYLSRTIDDEVGSLTLKGILKREAQSLFDEASSRIDDLVSSRVVTRTIRSWKLNGGVFANLPAEIVSRVPVVSSLQKWELKLLGTTEGSTNLINRLVQLLESAVDPLAYRYGILDSVPETVRRDWDRAFSYLNKEISFDQRVLNILTRFELGVTNVFNEAASHLAEDFSRSSMLRQGSLMWKRVKDLDIRWDDFSGTEFIENLLQNSDTLRMFREMEKGYLGTNRATDRLLRFIAHESEKIIPKAVEGVSRQLDKVPDHWRAYFKLVDDILTGSLTSVKQVISEAGTAAIDDVFSQVSHLLLFPARVSFSPTDLRLIPDAQELGAVGKVLHDAIADATLANSGLFRDDLRQGLWSMLITLQHSKNKRFLASLGDELEGPVRHLTSPQSLADWLRANGVKPSTKNIQMILKDFEDFLIKVSFRRVTSLDEWVPKAVDNLKKLKLSDQAIQELVGGYTNLLNPRVLVRMSSIPDVKWSSNLGRIFGSSPDVDAIRVIWRAGLADPLRDGIKWIPLSYAPSEMFDTLTTVFGGAARRASGTNGTVYEISYRGKKYLVKPLARSRDQGIFGEVLSDVFSDQLGMPPVGHVFIGDDTWTFDIMPDLVELGSFKYGTAAFSDASDVSTRQVAFLERLLWDVDGHHGNYVSVDDILYRVDKEFAWFHSPISTAAVDNPRLNWTGSQSQTKVNDLVLDWLRGETMGYDNPVWTNRPFVDEIILTPLEQTKLFGGPQIPTAQPGWLGSLHPPSGNARSSLTTLEVFAWDGKKGTIELVFPQHITTGDVTLHPGQLLSQVQSGAMFNSPATAGDAVYYLTTKETALVESIINGSLDDTLRKAYVDQYKNIDNGTPLNVNPKIAFAKKRLKGALDEGILVRDVDRIFADFGEGVGVGARAELGKAVELTTDNGDRVSGIVYHMFTDSEGHRTLYVLDGFRGEIDKPEVSMRIVKEFEIQKDVNSFLDTEISSWKGADTKQWSSPFNAGIYDDTNIVRYPVFDDLGQFQELVAADLRVDILSVQPRNGFSSNELATTAIEIMNEELKFVAPEYRPRVVEIISSPIKLADGRVTLGSFNPESKVMQLSLSKVFSGGSVDWQEFRRVIRHEFGHSIAEVSSDRLRAELSKKVLNDLMDATGAQTWRELNDAAGLLVRGDVDGGRLALNVLVEERTEELMKILDDVRTDSIRKKFAEIGSPEWAEAVRASKSGEIDGDWIDEFLAEAWAHSRAEGGSTVAPPVGLPDKFYWSLFWDERHLALTRGDIDLPDALDVWTPAKVKRDLRRILYMSDDEFETSHLLSRVHNEGFSFDVITGAEPTSGYMVALGPDENGVSRETYIKGWSKLTDDQKEEALQLYRSRHSDMLDQDRWYLGGWYKEIDENGKVVDAMVLDVSTNIQDEHDVVRFGIANKQEAIYDIAARDDIRLDGQYKSVQDYYQKRYPDSALRPEARIASLKGYQSVDKVKVAITLDLPNGVHSSIDLGSIEQVNEVLARKIEAVAKSRYALVKSEIWKDIDERILQKNHIPIEITVESAKENLRKVLRRAIESYEENPLLREEDKFYDYWLRVFEKLEGEVSISVPRLAAGAAVMSPRLDAVENLRRATSFARWIHQDRTIPPDSLNAIKKSVKTVSKALRKTGQIEQADVLDSLVLTTKTKLNDLPAEATFIAYRALYLEETGRGFGVAASKKFYEDAIRVMRGELDPDDVLGNSKVRSFYNNILDPKNVLGFNDITIDYHQGNMSVWALGFDNSNPINGERVINPSTGKPKTPGMGGNWDTPAKFGVSLGLRPILAQAIRELYDELLETNPGVLQSWQIESYAELQEVLWATWRRGLKPGWWGDLPRAVVRKGVGSK